MPNKRGRPTKYTNRTPGKTRKYLREFESDGDVIPTIEGLAEYLSVHRDTIYEWQKHEDKIEFSDILEKILSKQARILINKGLSSKFNSVMAKLMLTKHGYCDKQEIDQTIDDKKPKTNAERKARIKELEAKNKKK